MKESALLDTSFLIRLLSESNPLHEIAIHYYEYFLQEGNEMKVSTISIAEYCVKGSVDELPLRNLKVVPFNINHAIVAGKFAKIVFEQKRSKSIIFENRNIIPNDSKLFAQAHCENSIKYFVTSDTEALKVMNTIGQNIEGRLSFEHIDIHKDCAESFERLF